MEPQIGRRITRGPRLWLVRLAKHQPRGTAQDRRELPAFLVGFVARNTPRRAQLPQFSGRSFTLRITTGSLRRAPQSAPRRRANITILREDVRVDYHVDARTVACDGCVPKCVQHFALLALQLMADRREQRAAQALKARSGGAASSWLTRMDGPDAALRQCPSSTRILRPQIATGYRERPREGSNHAFRHLMFAAGCGERLYKRERPIAGIPSTRRDEKAGRVSPITWIRIPRGDLASGGAGSAPRNAGCVIIVSAAKVGSP